MLRSKVEKEIAEAKELLEKNNVHLPVFGYWGIEDFKAKKDEIATILKTARGWDITDFGEGDFDKVGATLFTIRNGVLGQDIGCPYAEKLIIMKEGQILPLHFHYMKHEDIINRCGGVLCIQVYNSLEDGELDKVSDVTVYTDGIKRTVKAGTYIELKNGDSLTIYPGLYHLFNVKDGTGPVVVGEVSSVNDDTVDNRFYENRPRFSGIVEDVPVKTPLLNEYDKLI